MTQSIAIGHWVSRGAHYVYRLYAADGFLLYVGCSWNVYQRLGDHAVNKPWFERVARVEIDEYPTEVEARTVEREMIRREQPPGNVKNTLRDDGRRGLAKSA